MEGSRAKFQTRQWEERRLQVEVGLPRRELLALFRQRFDLPDVAVARGQLGELLGGQLDRDVLHRPTDVSTASCGVSESWLAMWDLRSLCGARRVARPDARTEALYASSSRVRAARASSSKPESDAEHPMVASLEEPPNQGDVPVIR